MSFVEKVVIVTGAGSGIGAAIASHFANEGANVVLAGRSESKLKSILKVCEKSGNKHLAVIADVTKEDDAKKIIKNAIEKFDKIDVLVNNAGIVRFASLLDDNGMKAFDEIMSVNLRAPVYLTNLAAPHLIKSKGNIINISSISAEKITLPIMNSYGISKAALNRYTQGIAVELASHGVRVNTISPGPVRTEILANGGSTFAFDPAALKIPLGKVCEPSEIADLVLFLASEKAKSITGSDLVADNGLKVKF